MENLRYWAVPLLTRFVNGLRCGKVLTPRIREFQPDVIIGYFVYPMGFGALQAGRKLGIPTVIGAVGSDLRRMNGILVKPLVAQTVKNAAFVTTVSEELRQRAIAMGARPERCRTIHDGCDREIFHLGDRAVERAQLKVPEDAELIVFVGSLLPLKGIRELLEATAMLVPKRPNLRLVCVGEGPFEREFRSRASKSDLIEHVNFMGGAVSEELARWMTAADVFCLPSHSEGMPDVILEALNCGRPVVATDVGGIPEIVNPKCGVLTPAKDPKRLAEALSQALDKVWDEEEIARTFRWSWEDWAAETYEVCCFVARKP